MLDRQNIFVDCNMDHDLLSKSYVRREEYIHSRRIEQTHPSLFLSESFFVFMPTTHSILVTANSACIMLVSNNHFTYSEIDDIMIIIRATYSPIYCVLFGKRKRNLGPPTKLSFNERQFANGQSSLFPSWQCQRQIFPPAR